MSQLEKYYSNHSRAYRFPWSIYHRPLLEDLFAAIASIKNPSGKTVLVIGPGDFYEYQVLKEKGFKISVLDIDPRVIKDTQEKYLNEIEQYFLVNEDFSGYPDEKFDFIYAKEVIEHIPQTNTFLKKIFDLGQSETLFWFSTPNYGDWTLPFVENTFLELVARLSGFTRKGIHPRPFSKETLELAFKENDFSILKTLKTPYKFALTIWASKASENKE